MNAWVDASTGTPIDSDWDTACGCQPIDNVTAVQKTLTLYYKATSGQTLFLLSTADLYAKTYVLTATSALTVTRNGVRLMPDDGSGVGGYTALVVGNSVTLLWPAGDGEIVIIDIYDTAITQGPPGVAGPPGAPGPPGSSAIGQDALTIATVNIIPPLSRTPDGAILTLYVDGKPFFAIGPNAAFTWSGPSITWTSTLYSVPVGAEVIAEYSISSAAAAPPGWWLGLPTTLPPLPGVLWNNGGVICVS